jgi:hypothetical protein
VIRDEIEARGHACRHAILSREMRVPPPDIGRGCGSHRARELLHLRTLYTADGAPYVLEDRWINPDAVPAVREESFAAVSPNEWLVREVPFEGGDFAFSAMTATAAEAAALSCGLGDGTPRARPDDVDRGGRDHLGQARLPSGLQHPYANLTARVGLRPDHRPWASHPSRFLQSRP